RVPQSLPTRRSSDLRFILPSMVDARWGGKMSIRWTNGETIADLEKALCYISGENYENITTVYHAADDKEFGSWEESHFFRFKGFKKGTMHFEFKDDVLWAKFNQRVAKLKGYPLYEAKKQTAYQRRQTGRTGPKAEQ